HVQLSLFTLEQPRAPTASSVVAALHARAGRSLPFGAPRNYGDFRMQLKHGSAVWNCAAVMGLLATQVLWAESHLKSIKIAITNTTVQNRPAEDIVLQVYELTKIAPDLYLGSQIATASDASTIAEDAAVLHPAELPPQVDDLDGDLKPDELAFQIDLTPHQTR